MDRAFLEEKGLEKDVIDSVMAEYGKSVQTFKDQTATLNEQITALNEKTAEYERDLTETKEKYKDYDDIIKDRDGLKESLEQTNGKLERKTKEYALNNEAQKLGAMNANDIKNFIDIDSLAIDDKGNVVGLEKVAQLKTDKPYLFEQEKKETKVATGMSHDKGTDGVDDAFMNALGLPKNY